MWKTSKISDLRKKSGSGTLVCATIAAKAVSESVNVRIIKTQNTSFTLRYKYTEKEKPAQFPSKLL